MELPKLLQLMKIIQETGKIDSTEESNVLKGHTHAQVNKPQITTQVSDTFITQNPPYFTGKTQATKKNQNFTTKSKA